MGGPGLALQGPPSPSQPLDLIGAQSDKLSVPSSQGTQAEGQSGDFNFIPGVTSFPFLKEVYC